jgi:hypothetical protein
MMSVVLAVTNPRRTGKCYYNRNGQCYVTDKSAAEPFDGDAMAVRWLVENFHNLGFHLEDRFTCEFQ